MVISFNLEIHWTETDDKCLLNIEFISKVN